MSVWNVDRSLWRVALACVLLSLAASSPSGAAQSDLVVAGLGAPLMVAAPEGDDRLFIVLRFGQIAIYENGQILNPVVLNIQPQLEFSSEGGLLDMAFSPDFSNDGTFYVYYTATSQTAASESRVSSFQMIGDPATATVADPMSEDILFATDQPDNNHQGGSIGIRDGFLYLGLGDGGDDDGTGFGDNAQDDGVPLGKILRWDLSKPNPQTEIWAKGLRNPYRWSFDRLTGDLYIADVGQSSREEINVEPANSPGGVNYGWNVEEGSLCNDPEVGKPPCGSLELTRPVHEYDHASGDCSVTGGVVYRGSALPAEQGNYFFADWCSSRIWSLVWDGAGGTVGPVRDRTAELAPNVAGPFGPVGFGEDGHGEMYIVLEDAVFKVPEPSAAAAALAVATALSWAAQRRATGPDRSALSC